MRLIAKPQEGDYPPYAIMYIKLLPDDGLLFQHLRDAIERSAAFYRAIPAEKLDKPLGTVKTWIRQGLIRLRDALRSDSGEDEQRPRAGSSAIANTVDERSGPR